MYVDNILCKPNLISFILRPIQLPYTVPHYPKALYTGITAVCYTYIKYSTGEL